MAGMGAVEEAPFLSVQRSEKWVIQQQGMFSESSFCILQSCIHGDQGVVEAPHRGDAKTVLRTNLLKGFSTTRHPTEFRHNYFSHSVREGRNASKRLATLQNPSQTLGGPGIGKQQVLEDLRT